MAIRAGLLMINLFYTFPSKSLVLLKVYTNYLQTENNEKGLNGGYNFEL